MCEEKLQKTKSAKVTETHRESEVAFLPNDDRLIMSSQSV